MILPAVMEIKSIAGNNPQLPVGIAAFAETLGEKVASRYQIYYDDRHILLASVLDPRFKTEWIVRDENVSYKLGHIRELLIKEAEESSPTPTQPDTAASLDDHGPGASKRALFGSYYSEQQTSSTTPTDAKSEVELYLSSPRKKQDVDPIEFWRENFKIMPRLSKVAQKVFSIPSGSASVERVFSTAGLLARDHRMCLKPQTLAKLIFLKVNGKVALK